MSSSSSSAFEGRQIGDQRLQRDFGVDLRQAAGGGDGFRGSFRGVGFGKEELALQIAELDKIAVDDAQRAHARARQDLGLHRSQRAAADDGDARGPDAGLSLGAQGRKALLTGVTGIAGAHHIGRQSLNLMVAATSITAKPEAPALSL